MCVYKKTYVHITFTKTPFKGHFGPVTLWTSELLPHKIHRYTQMRDGVMSKVDKCGHGDWVFKLQWTDVHKLCNIILTFVAI